MIGTILDGYVLSTDQEATWTYCPAPLLQASVAPKASTTMALEEKGEPDPDATAVRQKPAPPESLTLKPG